MLPAIQGWTTYSHWVTNINGTTTSHLYAQPEFTDASGSWQTINSTVSPHDGNGQPFAAEGALRPVLFGDSASNLVTVSLDKGPITLSPGSGGPSLQIGTPKLDDGTVLYSGVAPHTDVRFRVTNSGIEQDLILKSASAPASFSFHISDPDHQLGAPKAESDGSVRFSSLIQGDLNLGLAAPLAYPEPASLTGPVAAVVGSATQIVTPSGDGFDVTVAVAPSFLAHATFPLVLDPDLTFYDANQNGGLESATARLSPQSTQCAGLSNDGGCYSLAYGENNTLYGVGGATTSSLSFDAEPERTYFEFDTASIPTDASIQDAYVGLYIPQDGCLGYQADSVWRCSGNPNNGGLLNTTYPSPNNVYNGFYYLEMHPMMASWSYNDTWDSLNGGNGDSSKVGALYDGVELGGFAPTSYESFYLSPITSLVQNWVSSPSQNYGFELQMSNDLADQGPGTGNDNLGGPSWVATNNCGSNCANVTYLSVTYITPPSAPQAPVAQVDSSTSVTLDWSAPASDGGAAIEGYEVYLNGGLDEVNLPCQNGACTYGYTWNNLSPGTTYTAYVEAYNQAGVGPVADATATTPSGLPTAPETVSASPGTNAATVSWTAPASNGGSQVTSYSVTPYDVTNASNPTQGPTQTVPCTASSCSTTISSLTDSDSYEFAVAATNSAGTGPAAYSGVITLNAPTTDDMAGGSNGSTDVVQCSSNEPIDCASGDYYQTVTDLSVPGRGQALGMARTYNSSEAGALGPFGYGWSSSYTMALATDSAGDATITQEDGATVEFYKNSDGTYRNAGRVFAGLVRNSDGSYTFTRKARQVFKFNSSGQLVAESDLNGYTTTLSYAGSSLSKVTDPAGRALTFSYGANGLVSSVADPGGRSVSYSYDSADDLTSVTDVGGGVTSYGYDSSHRLVSVTDPNTDKTTNSYDSSGRVVSQTDPLGRITSFSYVANPDGSTTTTITSPAGNVETETYLNGVLTSLTKGYGTSQAATWTFAYSSPTLEATSATDPNGHTTTATYDAAGNVLTSTDALGRKTTHTYDSLDDLTSVTDPLGHLTTMAYDSAGNLESVSRTRTETNQVQTMTYTYGDSSHPGDVTASTDPDGNTTTYTYDTYGELVSSTDPRGDVTTHGYTCSGGPSAGCFPNVGLIYTTVSPRGNAPGAQAGQFTTAYTYDPFGDVTSVTGPPTAAAPSGQTTTKAYDADRNLTSVTDPESQITSYTYDADNELTAVTQPDGTKVSYAYDADGQRNKYTDANDNATTYSYDPLDQLVTTTAPATAAASGGITTTDAYDPAGNLASVTDTSGRTTSYTYDAANELIGVSYSDGQTPSVSYAYDADGSRTSMTDGTGNTTYRYDSLERLVSTTNGAGLTVSYAYSLDNQVTALTYPDNTVVAKSYDSAGNLASVIDGQGHKTTFAYDPDNNQTSTNLANGATTALGYDNADELTSLNDTVPSGTSYAFNYTPNPDGLVSQASDPITPGSANPGQQSFGYDAQNRLTTASGAPNNYPDPYAYDPAGNLVQLASGVPQRFDAADELTSSGGVSLVNTNVGISSAATSLTVGLPAGTEPGDEIVVASAQAWPGSVSTPAGYAQVASYTGPGSAGANKGTNLAVFVRSAQAGDSSVTLSYSGAPETVVVVATYRGVDPKTPVESLSSSGGTGTASVTDPSLTTKVPYDQVVVLDAQSNAIHTNTPGWTPPAGATLRTEDWTATTSVGIADETVASPGATGSLTSSTTNSGAMESIALILQPVAASYQYDAQGQRTGSDNLNTGTTNSYSWNQAGELTGFNGVASYAYNGDGLRVTKTVGGATQRFAWDSTASAPEMLTDGSTDYIYGPADQVIEQYTPEQPITLVGTDNNSVNVAGGTITLYLPPGAAAGDEAIIFVDTTDSTAKANEVSPPSGYTESVGPIYNGTKPAIDGLELDVFTRTITASDIGASISITIPTGEASSANLLLYSGVDPSLPVDAITDGYLSSGTSVTLPSMNASVPNEVLVAGYAASGAATLNQDFTLPSDLKNEREGTVSGYIKVDSADESLSNPGATGPQQAEFSGAGAPLAVAGLTLRQPPSVLFYQPDGQGSTRVLTDMSGSVRAQYDYDPYGNVIAKPGNTAPTQLLYNGQFFDSESGLLYLRARYYEARTGQFITRDPLANTTGSPYAYAGNAPVDLADPTGQCEQPLNRHRPPSCEDLSATGDHTNLTVTYIGTATLNGQVVNGYDVEYGPVAGYIKDMTRATLKISGPNPSSRTHRYGQIGGADTNNHPYPGGMTPAHTIVWAVPGSTITIAGLVTWKPKTVDYHDYWFFQTWAHTSGVNASCVAD